MPDYVHHSDIYLHHSHRLKAVTFGRTDE